MLLGQRIKKIRTDKNLTQKELALKAKISRSYLADVENNRYNPSLSTLKEIAKSLNVSSDRLTGETASSIIEDRLDEMGLTLIELAEKAQVTLQFLINLDDIVPDDQDYASIALVAKAIELPPSTLRAALARQEAPAYEGPNSSAVEDFVAPYTVKPSQQKKPRDLSACKPGDKEFFSAVARAKDLPVHDKKLVANMLDTLLDNLLQKNKKD